MSSLPIEDSGSLESIGAEDSMANYLSLEEAAEKLGIPADQLEDLRTQGKVRGFRDGPSWKFPETEVETGVS